MPVPLLLFLSTILSSSDVPYALLAHASDRIEEQAEDLNAKTTNSQGSRSFDGFILKISRIHHIRCRTRSGEYIVRMVVREKMAKTYNSRYSLVVTHPTTNLPI
jgi:hypothetical protein